MNKILIAILFAAFMAGCGNRKHTSEACEYDHATETQEHKADDHGAEGDLCSESSDGHDHAGETAASSGGEAGAHEGEIIFTKAQADRTDFELIEVRPISFRDVIQTSGRIMAAQGDEASVVAPVRGIVSFAGKKITDGAAVSKGETLFSVSSKDMAEGDYVARTRAAYEQAKAAFERAEKLIVDQIISQTDYEQSRLAYDNAKTAYDAVAARSTGRGTGIVAPIGGFIKNISVNEGAFVEVGQTLGVISQNKRLLLRAEVSQRYLDALRSVSGANFKTPYDNRVYALDAMNGRLLSVGKSSDGSSVFIPVIFEFDNSGDVIPGSFVEVFLTTTPQHDVLTVPLTAVMEDQGVYYVFVQLDEEGYVKREVKLGANDGNSVRVLSGLKPGERVVSKGVAQVKTASFSGAIPHGHAH